MSDHHVAHGNVDVRLAIVERLDWGLGDVFSVLTSKSREFLQANVCIGKHAVEVDLVKSSEKSSCLGEEKK